MELTLSQGPFLILSDAHIGHSASRIEDVGQLGPLFKPGLTVIFNGDTFEMRRKSDREQAVLDRQKLETLLQEKQTKAIFVSGNHDPRVSETHYVEFPEEQILITHGDFLFHDVAPWSMNSALYERAHNSELKRLPPELMHDFAARLGAIRRATLAYDVWHRKAPPGWIGSLVHLAETAWPPWRPLSILKSWAEIPALAQKTVADYRPETRFILIGHSHLAGIWQRQRLTVINTGALMRGFTRNAVLIENHHMAVHRIEMQGQDFVLGEALAGFAI